MYTIYCDEELEYPTALAACDDIVGAVADDYMNKRWGRIEREDGSEVAVDIIVRPASSTPEGIERLGKVTALRDAAAPFVEMFLDSPHDHEAQAASALRAALDAFSEGG